MFWRFAKQNENAKTELTAHGELLFYMPTGGGSGASDSDFAVELGVWARRNGTGRTFESSTLFVLPSGARRSPDASWVLLSRWSALTDVQKEKPVPFAPDFVLDMRLIFPSRRTA